MKITARTRWLRRAQNIGFYALFSGVVVTLAWLSTNYTYEADWTAGNRNTISPTTRALLDRLEPPLEITAFVPEDSALHQRIKERISRYQRYKPDIQLHFVNPDLEPERTQAAGIAHTGQLLIKCNARQEIIGDMAEQTIANALQRLTRRQARWAIFLEGHRERDPFDERDQGLSTLAGRLKQSGLHIQPLNLVRTPVIPDNTTLLVLAAPRSELLVGEVELIQDYIEAGGNLLWLHDPGDSPNLQPLADKLAIHFVDGVVVDANPQLRVLLGIKHPAVVPVVDYPTHPVTHLLKAQTLFPFASGITHKSGDIWQAKPFLVTLPRTWSEVGKLTGKELSFSSAEGDTVGPLTLGLSLSRTLKTREQRLVILGDSDFLANGYIGHGANLELASNIFNWLSEDDELISILPKSTPDIQLELSNTTAIVIAVMFQVALPLALLATGYGVWFRRRRR
jgi:ABC-type uncharacterized transport system involved in gliding motility auxiliary subunit